MTPIPPLQSGIFSCLTCFSNETNHALALVGYSLVGSTPFWVLRNSWGTSWGIGGYMDMAITDGVGVCGINLLPAIMPILQKSMIFSVFAMPGLSSCFLYL